MTADMTSHFIYCERPRGWYEYEYRTAVLLLNTVFSTFLLFQILYWKIPYGRTARSRQYSYSYEYRVQGLALTMSWP